MNPAQTLAPSLALVAEDEPLLAQALLAELRLAWPDLQTVHAADGESALATALQRQPQLCFLDIRMPGMTGLEVAQALAEDWPEAVPFPLLVFVTAYDQYALQAFEVQAVDYLVKPITRERLVACVKRLQGRLASGNLPQLSGTAAATDSGSAAAATGSGSAAGAPLLEQTLLQLRNLLGQVSGGGAAGSAAGAQAPMARLDVIQAQVGAVVHMVPVDQVIYFEAADKYVRVVTAEREHLVRASLRDLLPQLDPQRFWQVHRGTIVQARCVVTARREESGKVTLSLQGRPEKLVASRLYAHLFKGM